MVHLTFCMTQFWTSLHKNVLCLSYCSGLLGHVDWLGTGPCGGGAIDFSSQTSGTSFLFFGLVCLNCICSVHPHSDCNLAPRWSSDKSSVHFQYDCFVPLWGWNATPHSNTLTDFLCTICTHQSGLVLEFQHILALLALSFWHKPSYTSHLCVSPSPGRKWSRHQPTLPLLLCPMCCCSVLVLLQIMW